MEQTMERLPSSVELPVGDTIFIVGLFYETESETLSNTIERLIKEEIKNVIDE